MTNFICHADLICIAILRGMRWCICGAYVVLCNKVDLLLRQQDHVGDVVEQASCTKPNKNFYSEAPATTSHTSSSQQLELIPEVS